MMRAVAVAKFKDVPVMMDLPKPKPKDGEILVHLAAAGVNPFDWKVIDGVLEGVMPHVFPMIVGVDGAGVVEEVGPGVTRFEVGDGVFGQFLHPPAGANGTYAEFVTAPETLGLAKTPRGIYSAQAAAVPTSGMTALYALDSIGLAKGQVLLIVGAAGGVGSFATQLASNQGIRVVAASRGPHREFLHKLGATEFLNSGGSSFLEDLKFAHPGGVDALLDLVDRGEALDRLLPLIRPNGVVASTIGAVDAAQLTSLGLRGMNIDMTPTSGLLDRLSAEISAGRLRIPAETQVPLAEAANAIAQSREGKARGKIVVVI
jgi:NADPH2:quinone reductase